MTTARGERPLPVGRAGGAAHQLLAGPARAVGVALGGLLGAAARVTGRRPLHPRGVVLRGTVQVGLDPGAPGAVEPCTAPAVVRVSRAAGLPRPWPDVHGLAVRWERAGRPQALLLSSAGLGTVSRFVLALRRDVTSGPLTTLMPFRTPAGPVVLGAVVTRRVDGGLDVELRSAHARGRWHRWGAVQLDPPHGPSVDSDVRVDPVVHCPDGLATYPWAAAVRRPAYRAARVGAPHPAPLPW
ncbi:hypothetical protein [Cellulomonas fimi]|uniref:Phosphodiesterase n=1 Tax=Cellulomonas fimi (strain ATCC 484 / DSM 20113 / JCM 1341 / CCUG 24087 / LMG 16345 / NBRC 15513 / NCIMB 8980 / NCTC 7547 / NRS-133) TaxID=590998 RepID=F4H406_CELFA|nr:hypothetical protein [Cellulomonas fimi]AEE45358.1 hypothetical protein Celf_1223 [Cellulomonas fimi ATCC 484]NNH08162.1 hypothetical protein [Cellulomonas fimi]VEH29093.1 Uncharacterised protein [Cellulomonas fimi]